VVNTQSALYRLKLTELWKIPERLQKFLIRHGSLGIGSRVLFVGPPRPLLPKFCQELGMSGSILLDEDASLARWQQKISMPISTLRNWGNLPYPDHHFDVILLDERFPQYQQNLLGLEASTLTANLLASLRPGGLFVCHQRFNSRKSEPAQVHLPECFDHHLQRFSGCRRKRYLRDSFWRAVVRGRGITRKSRPGFWLTSIQVPAESMSRQEWLWQAQEASPHTCCAEVEPATLFPRERAA